MDNQSVQQPLAWDTDEFKWGSSGSDRGFRGIAADNDCVFVVASDELFAFSPEFELIESWRNPYLQNCQEIFIWERTLYVVSRGFDSIVGFHLDEHQFHWALHIQSVNYRFKAVGFDPATTDGPLMMEKLHLSNVFCNSAGMYVLGQKTAGMLHFNGKDVNMAVQLPAGSHNAQPFRNGVLFNDSEASAVRYTGRDNDDEDRAIPVPTVDAGKLTMPEDVDIASLKPGYARGLCVLNDHLVAGGSSPSTVTVYDLAANEIVLSVNLSMDVRNAIHGLEVWPY